MTARPFSRLEPVSNPSDPARVIATLFAIISGIGLMPAMYGILVLGIGFLATLSNPNAGSLTVVAVLGYIVLGLAQCVFYFRRTCNAQMPSARRWWLSTYFYNMLPCAAAVALFIQKPHVGSVIAALWFAVLSMLALVALGAEPRGSARRARGSAALAVTR